MKKLVLIMMASILMMTSMTIILPNSTYAEMYKVTNKDGDVITKFSYDIVEDYAEITDITSIRTDTLTIPSEIAGYPVRSVRGIYFDQNPTIRTKIKTINFEDGIEIIDKCSFSQSPNLTELHLPNTLKSGEFSFWNCDSLESVTIPGSLERIPDDAFYDCNKLRNITIENGVKVIGKRAFSGCTSLNSIVIPDSVYNIDDYAFSGCENLKNITLPKNLEYIGDYAFYHSGIEEIKLPSGLKEIGEQALGYTPLKEIKLPDSLESIGYETFKGCKSLTKAYIPKGIMSKPNRAFYACDNLCDVTFSGELTKELYDHLMAETAVCKAYDETVSDDFVIFEGNYLASYKGADKNPVIPDKVTVLSEQAFQNADIDTVTFSPNIKEIPSMCFMGSHIKELVIPSTVKKVQERAFYGCRELEKITVEDGVERIASNAFQMCYKLSEENVSIGKSVRVDKDAFKQTPLDKELIEHGQWNPSFATPKPEATKQPDTTANPQTSSTPKPAAAYTPKKLSVQGGDTVTVNVGGIPVTFTDAKPFVDANNRTQIPVRAVAEMLDCSVDWNGDNKTATITNENGDIIKLTLDSDIMIVSDKQIKMDTAAIIKDNRTYIPVRFVAEALGMEVEWIK